MIEANELPPDLFAMERGGTCFELVLRFDGADAEALRRARDALWRFPDLRGPLEHEARDARTAPLVSVAGLPLSAVLYGAARIPGEHVVACMSFAADPVECEGQWEPYLDLTIYEESLAKAYDIGLYPFDDKREHPWIAPLSDWFRRVAEQVHAAVPVVTGAVGCELMQGDYLRDANRVPRERWCGYFVRQGETLAWFPPNVFRAPFGFDPPAK